VTDFEKLLAILRFEEGLSLTAYPDPEGQTGTWACASGHQLTDKVICAALGAGGTLTCDKALAEAMLREDAHRSMVFARNLFSFYSVREEGARLVAAALAIYQIGSKFCQWHDMRVALSCSDWPAVAAAMRASEWHDKQTPARAERVCKMIATGEWPKGKRNEPN